jgi:IS5 family transposase
MKSVVFGGAMLRMRKDQRDFWESLLPPEALRLSPELEAVDTLLDDEAFLVPFRKRFPAKRGRYTIPMETYLRLMYLKRRYQLG